MCALKLTDPSGGGGKLKSPRTALRTDQRDQAPLARTAKVVLERTPFATSRLLEFLSEKELVAQTGHSVAEWPLVILKELFDNALDACEESGIAPELRLKVNQDGIAVSDNGPGIPPEVVRSLTNFSVRVSAREAYVSPTRGLQGNALKTMLGIPFVLDGTVGSVIIEARGIRHDIQVRVDRIRQRPVIEHHEAKIPEKPGTSVSITWPNSPRSQPPCSANEFLQNGGERGFDSPRSILQNARARFLQIADDFFWLNPHLSLELDWHGERTSKTASSAGWRKWTPAEPTDPHWYGVDELERLVAAYIAHDADQVDRDRTLREFVTEFRGLSGTAKVKQVLEGLGLSRARLSELVHGQAIDRKQVAKLLAAMQSATRPVKAQALGFIGEEHLTAQFASLGCEMKSFAYRRLTGTTGNLPWVIETAFGWCPDAMERRLITGVNWSPGIINPFRQLGASGESLDSILEEQRAGHDEPTALFLHVACPRVRYADRGKSSVIVEH